MFKRVLFFLLSISKVFKFKVFLKDLLKLTDLWWGCMSHPSMSRTDSNACTDRCRQLEVKPGLEVYHLKSDELPWELPIKPVIIYLFFPWVSYCEQEVAPIPKRSPMRELFSWELSETVTLTLSWSRMSDISFYNLPGSVYKCIYCCTHVCESWKVNLKTNYINVQKLERRMFFFMYSTTKNVVIVLIALIRHLSCIVTNALSLVTNNLPELSQSVMDTNIN